MRRKGKIRVHRDRETLERLLLEQKAANIAMYDRLRRANTEERREIADRNFVLHGLDIEIIHEKKEGPLDLL